MTFEAGLAPTTDLHSHLVPGVDDGAPSLEDALEGIGRMVERGIRRIVTTPHLEGSLTLNSSRLDERLAWFDEAFEETRSVARSRWPDLRLERSNEVALDHPMGSLSDPRLRLGTGSFTLVEWPRLQVPPGSSQVLERLTGEGYELLLAHPERYASRGDGMARLERWRATGARFQVNYGSIAGVYGEEVRRRAMGLLSRGWVDCLATDFHGRPGLRLFIVEARERIRRIEEASGSGSGSWDLLARTNPERIAEGEPPHPVPPLPWGEGIWERVTALLRPGRP